MTPFDSITEDDVRAAIDKVDFKLTSMNKEEFARRMMGLIRGELLPKDVQGIDDAQMEQLYALAYNALQAGRPDEARKIFQFLCESDFTEGRHWLGLGASRYAMDDHPGALQAYAMACLAAPEDPRPRLRSADCWLALGDLENALMTLNEGLALCGERHEHAVRKNRATALRKLLVRRQAEAAEV